MISILLSLNDATRDKVKAALADGNPSRFLETDNLPFELTSTMSGDVQDGRCGTGSPP